MANKYLSLIIIPHHKGKRRTLTFSHKSIKILGGISAVLFIALVVFLVDYFMMRGLRQEFKTLSAVKTEQEATLNRYEKSIDELNAKIDVFESYRQKLNVMAGLKSQEVIEIEPGLGGGENGQEVSLPESNHQINLNRLEDINKKADGIANNLNTLTNFYENQMLELAATPSISPTKGYWASPFGWRDDPFTGKRTFHPGVDIATHNGNPVVATADGLVLSTQTDRIGGKTIKISHPNSGYVTIYCHLSKYMVKPGQRVKRGDTLGLVGKTGRARGPHVHYEVRLNGKRLNPWYYILDN
ncbi:MAG: peptidoglycan DD-metalloendopeptidase family protein [Candidatus Aminicenantes bacterium]|nr:peptidoglycan DD-metalloendopeptidase family protein [Candidatus Aminicenantes bacterium]